MVSKAILRFVRVSPRKTRHIADMIRGKKAQDAKSILEFTPQKPARIMKKLLDSAVANASLKKDVDPENLYIKTVMVDGGPVVKRFLSRSMGRADRITKRTSHITIILDEK